MDYGVNEPRFGSCDGITLLGMPLRLRALSTSPPPASRNDPAWPPTGDEGATALIAEAVRCAPCSCAHGRTARRRGGLRVASPSLRSVACASPGRHMASWREVRADSAVVCTSNHQVAVDAMTSKSVPGCAATPRSSRRLLTADDYESVIRCVAALKTQRGGVVASYQFPLPPAPLTPTGYAATLHGCVNRPRFVARML